MLSRRCGGRARKHLVPGGKSGSLAIDDDAEFDRIRAGVARIGIAHCDGGPRFVFGERVELRGVGLGAKARGPVLERRSVGTLRSRCGRFEQRRADLGGNLQVVRIDAAREVVTPRKERVDPRGDRVAIAAHRSHDK